MLFMKAQLPIMYCDALAFTLQVAYFIGKNSYCRMKKMISGRYRIESTLIPY